jgi:hypothetical protein
VNFLYYLYMVLAIMVKSFGIQQRARISCGSPREKKKPILHGKEQERKIAVRTPGLDESFRPCGSKHRLPLSAGLLTACS